MGPRPETFLAVFTLSLILSTPACLGGEKIEAFIMGLPAFMDALTRIFDYEPLVTYQTLIMRSIVFDSVQDNMKLIRLYFPRDYEGMKKYDLILLTSVEYNLLTNKQDKWIYDAIREGSSGINDGSVFSIMAPISTVWANSQAARAFPNDAQKVDTMNWRSSSPYKIIVNPDHPEPILTPFIPLGAEVTQAGGTNMVIAKEGAHVLAWNIGTFASRTDWVVNWEYENGRTVTMGGWLGTGWFGFPGRESEFQYSLETFMNVIFWLTKRPLIDDILVFHRVKTSFDEYRSRLGVLISLRDFIDKFGANTQKIQNEIEKLQSKYDEAAELYLDSRFVDSEEIIKEGLALFPESEDIARREKDAALLWVYIIEWLVASSTLFFSGFVLWTLMVKRRLYREVEVTRLDESQKRG